MNLLQAYSACTANLVTCETDIGPTRKKEIDALSPEELSIIVKGASHEAVSAKQMIANPDIALTGLLAMADYFDLASSNKAFREAAYAAQLLRKNYIDGQAIVLEQLQLSKPASIFEKVRFAFSGRYPVNHATSPLY